MRVLLFLSLFFSLSVLAQDPAPACSGTMVDTKHFPENNDLDFQSSWCIFWTSADLFSFYEQAPLSAYDLALQYFNNDTIRKNQFNPTEHVIDMGGNPKLALIAGQSSKGLCLESQTNFTDSDWSTLASIFVSITDPKATLIATICTNDLRDTLPFVNIPTPVLMVLNQLSADKKAAALLDVTCGMRHKFKNKYGVGNRALDKFTDDKIMARLDDLLTKKEPISLRYDPQFIKENESYTRNMEEGYITHTSTVIGRRLNPKTNKCEYLLKDSAGNRCLKKSIYECDKSTGLMWIPRENLQKNLYEINWLVKSP